MTNDQTYDNQTHLYPVDTTPGNYGGWSVNQPWYRLQWTTNRSPEEVKASELWDHLKKLEAGYKEKHRLALDCLCEINPASQDVSLTRLIENLGKLGIRVVP